MDKKLNLHDIFGILFPGAVLCASVYAFLVAIDRVPTGRLDWSATLALLPVAYVAGLFLHQFSSWLLHERYVALTLMQDTDGNFTPEFKSKVKAAFEDVFKLPHSGDAKTQQMMFNGCYDYVIQQGKGIYIENQYATYALCRSMIFVSLVAGVLAGWAVLRDAPLRTSDYGLAAVVVLVMVLAVWIFWRAKDRFIRIFAMAVYRAFYSAYCDCKMPCKKASASGPDAD